MKSYIKEMKTYRQRYSGSEQKMDDYVNASQQVLDGFGKHSPSLSVPADQKWYRNYLVATMTVETLEKLKMKFTK